ncbi:hypothetical protein FisN_10Lh382 [Fistulifera solaris]|uniref:Uncharacterized protein n=1 Tax=Fistulifera solaris TaxID=1519565 RepID=A0A1Z5JV18_FISSO|nr:hypothetical protein FisN_10Lh382 [Fistulifera solaris]|eukprot:GAX17682.1 hypothetical protein FisN_10Lh382 [Fistulifera solaris]
MEPENAFLELIPEHQMTARQTKLQRFTEGSLYRLRRIPTHFSELLNGRSSIAIWRSNETMIISLKDRGSLGVKHCSLVIDQTKIAIYGCRHCRNSCLYGGTAFVTALEERTVPFGSLSLTFGNHVEPPCIRHANLLRLFHLDTFEKLHVSNPDRDCVLPLLSAKVNALECYIHAEDVAPADFDSLNIVAKDLNIKWNLSHTANWSDILIAFFDRLATLGHVEKLACSARNGISLNVFGHDAVAPVAEALVRAIRANPALQHLELSHEPTIGLDWTSHMQSIFQSLEEHPSIRTLTVREVIPYYDTRTDEERQEYFSWLERLLSRNHNITVLDTSAKRVTNGSSIDQIYRDRIYHRAATLQNEPLQTLWMATALTESAYQNFRHTVHLLSIHTDALCKLVESCVNPDENVASHSVSERAAQLPSPNSSTDVLKRKLTIQPTGEEAKKVRNEC